MSNFPTLSTKPIHPLGESREDNVIRSPMEAGYEKTRPRYTRLRKSWQITYECISNTDKETLETFFDTTLKGGSETFNWTHPTTSTVYEVRLKKPPKFDNIVTTLWNVQFDIGEV